MKACKCGTTSELKDMIIKMGGLLCPKCRIILFQPYVDKEYFQESTRRRNQLEKDEKKDRQKST